MKSRPTILFLLVIYVLITSSCEQNAEYRSFDIEGKSSIHFINNTEDSVNIRYRNFTIWPYKDNRIKKGIAPKSELDLFLTTQGKNDFHLTVGNSSYNLFSFPSSKDTITITQSSEQNKSIKFTGQLKSINEFLDSKTSHFRSLMSDRMGRQESMLDESNSLKRILEVNDSITALNSNFINANSSSIPNWYLDFALRRLGYVNAWSKMNAVFYKKLALHLPDSIPDNFLDNTLLNIKIEDTTMIGNLDYMNFLNYIVTYKNKYPFNTKVSQGSNKEKSVKKRIELIKNTFSGLTKDALLVSELSANIEGNSIYDSTWFELVGQEALRTFLKNYYRTYEYPEVLKKGANIPYFYLPDTSNNYFEPNNFRNQIVLINFWYPGCKGCIIRFREENELVEKYKDRPISIVNICTNAPSEEVWKSTIVKNNVKALNLLASDNWKERIKSSFGIRSYPHSVLINWNGKIVQNKCSRLSQTIGEQIDELLNEMEKEGNIL